MKRLSILLLFATAIFAQGGGQPVIIPVPITAFELGYGQTNFQDLGIAPAQLQTMPPYSDGVYQLGFVVQSTFPSYPGYFEFQVDFGTQEMCSGDGWGTHAFTQIMVTCPVPGYIVFDQALPGGGPVQGAQDLKLTVSVPSWSWPIKFGNLSLTFTPTN